MNAPWCLEENCAKDQRQIIARLRALTVAAAATAIAGGAAIGVVRFGIEIGDRWPAAVVLAGATLLLLAVPLKRPGEEWLLLVGAAVAVTGGILWYQHDTGRWATWVYAWTLVVPGSLGLSLFGVSLVSRRFRHVRWPGVRLVGLAAALFVSGALLFEGALQLDAFQPVRAERYVFAGALAVLGLAALIVAIVGRVRYHE